MALPMAFSASRALRPMKSCKLNFVPHVPRVVANASQSSNRSQGEVSLGIDLGTTYSVAALVVDESEPILVPTDPSDKNSWKLPSVVAYRSGEDVLVGEAAVRQAAKNPKNTFYSVKRWMGKVFSSIEEVRAALEDVNTLGLFVTLCRGAQACPALLTCRASTMPQCGMHAQVRMIHQLSTEARMQQ
jgi:hypothetical protein